MSTYVKNTKPYYFKAKFTSDDGHTIEVRYRGDRERPEQVVRRGKVYRYDYDRTFNKHVPLPAGLVPLSGTVVGGRSTCDALSVIPQQREEAIQHALAKGLTGFNFDSEGTLTFDSRRARKEFVLAYGHFDKRPGFNGSVYRDQMHRYRENRRED
jgi:hypothetical protein